MTTPTPEPILVTEEQVAALDSLVARFGTLPEMLGGELGFFETLMVRIGEMWIGIEPDGYAHS